MTIFEAIAQGDLMQVRNELAMGASLESRDEHGHTPLACAARSLTADGNMLRLLIDAGADVNAAVHEGKSFALELAAQSGDLEKVRCLLEAGANARQETPKGYSVLLHAVYRWNDDERLVPMINLLVRFGADADKQSDYGESPIRTALKLGRLDAVQCLLDLGADPEPLKWSALERAIAVGTVDEVARRLSSTPLAARDRQFALHLAALAGDVAKAELLHSGGCELDHPDRDETPLTIAVSYRKLDMVRWLIGKGVALQPADEIERTPLMRAAYNGDMECVRLLLEAGADAGRRDDSGHSAIASASNEPIVRLLMEHGLDLSEISEEMKRQLVGLPFVARIDSALSDYQAGRDRRFGRSNPEVMEIPFWHAMVRAGRGAYAVRSQFGDSCEHGRPVWCFYRFGMSFTELPDGRFVQIAGEHEDYYDPDFCIYNEVVIHQRSGEFQILGYPEDVFPPTDFHTATYFEGSIFIVGSLGYLGTRKFGTTPVYRLDCESWRIEAVETWGENPGWIYKHRTQLDGASLIVSDGTICEEVAGEERHVANKERYRLDLNERRWTQL